MKGKVSSIVVIITILLSIIIIPTAIFIAKDWRYYKDEEVKVKVRYLITDDEDFTKRYHFSGSGTPSDPYLLANLAIDDRYHYGIVIQRTKKYFSIVNCSITVQHTGILLKHQPSGYGKIINNTIKTVGPKNTGVNYRGVFLYFSKNTTLESNVFTSVQEGINPVGILSYGSDNLTIRNNIFSELDIGVSIGPSDYHEMKSNSFYDNRIGYYGNWNWFSNISFNSYSDNNVGIYFFDTCWSNIFNNSFNNYIGTSIYFYKTHLIQISFNNISTGFYGVELQSSSQMWIHQNNFYQIISPYNQPSMGFDNGTMNWWYDYYSMKGNYWSNFEWAEGVAYQIDGPANNSDIYPLESKVRF